MAEQILLRGLNPVDSRAAMGTARAPHVQRGPMLEVLMKDSELDVARVRGRFLLEVSAALHRLLLGQVVREPPALLTLSPLDPRRAGRTPGEIQAGVRAPAALADQEPYVRERRPGPPHGKPPTEPAVTSPAPTPPASPTPRARDPATSLDRASLLRE
ncbi:MAG: hypothetical protein R3B70_41185 [Polyangiaceae bacterium]